MTTQLAPPPVIPIPPASPQPLPPLAPRYQPFQAWDDDRINWDDLEWKEDKYCGQVPTMLVALLEYHKKIENALLIQNAN
ncbi:hypothetical protein AMATHDRAFT_9172 [Amanita thiersii Skay4041]|uniref:Uncharacterized protein n=1 Tax=Amanita thiersii Skay4041 TaxID=703135 RepID=A0A2A9NCL6_9AGAR|nr:hypothetical protein AMATHDRAFT_9172 [Amanita thiersii Skay4041]